MSNTAVRYMTMLRMVPRYPKAITTTELATAPKPAFIRTACIRHQRYLDFPKGFWRLFNNRQLGRAQCRVREHVYETGGELGIWGHIKQYWFYYKKNAAYLLTLNGEVIGKHEGPVPNQAIETRELNISSLTTREAQQ